MCTRVLRQPILFLRVRFSICVRCSILISLIDTVRCSIFRCSIPHCIIIITDAWWWPCAAETCCILIPTVNWRCHWQFLYCLLYISDHIGVYTLRCKGKYFILRTKMLYISGHSSPQYQFDVSRGPCFVGQCTAVQYKVLIVWSTQISAGKVLIPRSAGKKKSLPQNMPWRPWWGVDVQFYSFFNLGAGWGWVVNATPRPLYPQERPGTHCTGRKMDPRAGLDRCKKSRPHQGSIFGPRSP